MTRVWQIAAGAGGRDYSALFLAHDLMFLGPSYPGKFDRATYEKEAVAGDINGPAVGMIDAFCGAVSEGDIVLLRRGNLVLAIGVVHAEGYCHDPTFDDVHGWDVGHTRRVVWQDHLTAELATIQVTSNLFASRMRTFARVYNADVLGRVQALFPRCAPRPLRPRPLPLPEPLTLDALSQALSARGLDGVVVERVSQAIEHQRQLLAWYREFGGRSSRPNEHEVVAHMILPLLRALGWSERLLAVEWQDVDIAGFSGAPTDASKCVLVCEAKALWHGLDGAREQAIGYVEGLALTSCRSIVVTQGARFYLYQRAAGGSWPETPTGYINIEHIRTDHVTSPGTDAVATLLALIPAVVLGNTQSDSAGVPTTAEVAAPSA